MTEQTRFVVLASTDEGDIWKLYRGVQASSTAAACRAIQKARYADDVHAMFYATQRFTPRKIVEKLVSKLEQVELDAPEPLPRVMPHEAEPES